MAARRRRNPPHTKPSTGTLAQVRWIVDRMHVGKSDDSVAAEIQGRANGAVRRGEVTPGFVNAIVRHAIKVHHRNQDEYRSIMGGRK